MDKTVVKRLVFIALVVCLAGCSSYPKQTSQQEKHLVSQVGFYDREAQDWRAAGHQGMGDYFEQKSKALQVKKRDLDESFLDFLIDIIFD